MEMNDSTNSEINQCVSVLYDMEQSQSKIDKIDEESQDGETYGTRTLNNDSDKGSELKRSSILQSKVEATSIVH